MDEEIVIKTEEIEIDDTKIKLEVDENETALELPCAGSFMSIIEEQPNMITVPVHDIKSEDEVKFIESLSTLEQQQKLFVTSSAESVSFPVAGLSAFACQLCSYTCENHSALSSHQANHQLNRLFCCHGCGFWCNTLEDILEHEYRQHVDGPNSTRCRICQFECNNVANLTKHMSIHDYVRRFVCSICRQHFESPQYLQLHRQNSTEMCGRLKYKDTPGSVGQLVAVSKLVTTQPTEMLCDVKIKSEPLDIDDQQTEYSDIAIKTEPLPDEDEFLPESDDSWSKNCMPEQLRGKLRLPALKKPALEEIVPKKKPSVPSDKRKPTSMPNATPSMMSPVPAKAKSVNNQPKIIPNNISKTDSNIVTNVLKVLPSNCMVVKLPPNTKLMKLAPTTAAKNTNCFTIGSKIITLPNSMTISSRLSTTAAEQTGTHQPQIVSATINRSSHLSAIGLFESLPESRKIISEFQNQIRNIEQTLPLPGSVLHPKSRPLNLTLPWQLQLLKMPLTMASNAKLRQMRYAYDGYHFHWECPKCARCFEQFAAFCRHLTVSHDIKESEFERLEVEVKTYKKSDKSIPATSDEVFSVPSVKETVPESQAPSADDVAVPQQEAVTVPAPASLTNVLKGVAEAQKNSATAQIPATLAKPASSYLLAPYECTNCSKCFTTKGGLRIHQMIHTGELPHKCNYCDKRFRTPGQVRVHHRRHTGEKPFKCTVCSLDFTHRETLISHLSRHIGMKRYKCYGCDKNFVVVSGLRAHRRLRPDTCGKVKFTARAHGPRVRVIRGKVFFEPHPEHNGYLRSEDPLNIMSEMNQASKDPTVATESSDE